MSDSFAISWTVPTRFFCPWNFPGNNTGLDCHFLLQGNLPDPGIKTVSPELAGRFFTTEPPVKWVMLLSHVRLFVTPWTVAHQAPLSMEFFRQGYWSGLPFPPPGDLTEPPGKPICYYVQTNRNMKRSKWSIFGSNTSHSQQKPAKHLVIYWWSKG